MWYVVCFSELKVTIVRGMVQTGDALLVVVSGTKDDQGLCSTGDPLLVCEDHQEHPTNADNRKVYTNEIHYRYGFHVSIWEFPYYLS